MPSIPHMLNPYKFATYEFMRQYFSISPTMYLQYNNGSTSIPGEGNVRNYAYNDILKRMILPFESKFNSYSDTPTEETMYRDYSDPSDKYIRSGNSEEYDLFVSDYDNNYFYGYHGQIFAAFIPIRTVFNVLRHREYETYTIQNIDYPIFTSNFYSTHTRTGYPSRSFSFTSSSYNYDMVGETSNNPNHTVPGTSNPERYNYIVSSKGLYSAYFGSRIISLNGSPSDINGHIAGRENSYPNCMNFTNTGGHASKLPAYKLLNKLLTGSASNFPTMIQIEFDLIVGMNTHSQELARVSGY